MDERVLDNDEAWEAAKAKRSEALITVVSGVALLFASNIHWGAGVGGVLMVFWGGWKYVAANRAAKQAYDPWQDRELDAWEDDQLR